LVPGAGSEIYRGLATVIVGGMSVSAVFTLLLLPSILRIGESRRIVDSNQVNLPENVLAQPRMTS
jgi:Cu/Ag efflux pump CusA